MANPIFDSAGLNLSLTSSSPMVCWCSPRPRHQAITVPSVSGAFIANYGVGHREIVGRGYLEAAGNTGDLAQKALKAAVRLRQLAVNLLIGTFTDTDGESHGNCLLTCYEPVGSIEISAGAGTKTARAAVRFVILQQDPS